jgi:hypothetical protein
MDIWVPQRTFEFPAHFIAAHAGRARRAALAGNPLPQKHATPNSTPALHSKQPQQTVELIQY